MGAKILFHGSPHFFEAFQTPTGASGMDVTQGGVVYLGETPEQVARYAKGGYVYEVEVADAVSYAEQRRRQGLPKKKGRYTRGVWVALPEDCTILQASRVS